MDAQPLPRRAVLATMLLLVACLSDRVVAPDEPLPPVLALDKPSVQLVRFALGRSRAADTVRITNNGEQALGDVTVESIDYVTGRRQGWLATSVVQEDPNRALLLLVPTYVDTAGAPPDTAIVTVRGGAGTAPRPVTVVARTIPGARFEFSVDPMTFATLPGESPLLSQELTVRNGGNDTLRIRDPRIAYDGATGWLTAVRRAATDSTSPAFALDARPPSLPSGLHTAWVVFESAPEQIVRAPPDSVRVQLRVGAPRLGASASQVVFTGIRGGDDAAPQLVTLTNVGEGTDASLGTLSLDPPRYAPGDPTGWLAARLQGSAVTLEATTGGLAEGTYAAMVDVASQNGGVVSLAATFEVRLPGLTLSSRTLSFSGVEGGTSPAGRTVLVSNSGSGSLATLGTLAAGPVRYPPGQPAGWLGHALVDSVLTATPVLGALAAGTYLATVPVTSEHGGADDLSVTFTVARATDPPALRLSATSVAFSGVLGDPDPPAQAVRISNGGGGALGTVTIGSITSTGGWLDAVVQGQEVILSARTGSQSAGTHTGAVSVGSQNGGTETIAVSFTVGVPKLALSSSTASFSATQGGPASPASGQIAISNAGAGTVASLGAVTLGTISYGAGQPTGWLTATLAGAALTVSATPAGLAPGLYAATVPVSSAHGGSAALDVSLSVATIAAQPDLALSANAISMSATEGGPSPPPQAVSWFNSGGGVDADLGAVTVTLAPAAPWLAPTAGAQTVSFTASVAGLAAGTHSTTATVAAASGGSEAVAVTLTVVPAGAPPALALSSESASFAATAGGADPPAQTIVVSNAGGGALGTVTLGAVTYGAGASGWLAVAWNPATSRLTLTPSTGALSIGSFLATFPVAAAGAGVSGTPVTVTVALTVADPPGGGGASTLQLSATSASFGTTEGSSPGPQTIEVYNAGGGTLGSIALGAIAYGGASSGWLTAQYSAAADRITLTPSTASLPPGSSTATFAVSASSASAGSPATVVVRLSVSPAPAAPVLTLSASDVSFAASAVGADPPDQVVTVGNPGGGSLGTVTLGGVTYGPGAAGWLTRSLSGATITLGAQTAALGPGAYTATLQVNASGSGVVGTPATVTVNLTVASSPASPALTLSSRAVSFSAQAGSSAAPQTVTAVNTGGGTYASLGAISTGSVTYTGASGWLATSVNQGTGVITLTPATSSLPAGTSTAVVPVSSVHGGSSSITVRVSIAASNAPPSLALSLTSLTFRAVRGGAAPPTQTVQVTNAGGGTLSNVAVGAPTHGTGQPTGWLASPMPGPAAAGAVPFSVSPGSLAAGVYTAGVPIASSNGGSDTVAVTLQVQAPILTLSARSVSFSATQGEANPGLQTVTITNTGVGTDASLGKLSLGGVSYGTGEPGGWLAGSLQGTTITLRAVTGTLPSGTLTARLPVSSEFGGSETITVSFTVAPGAAPPVLALSATDVTFGAIQGGASPAPQSVAISNQGGQTLGALSLSSPSPAAPWLQAALQGTRAVFIPASGGLPAGTYETTVTVESANAGSQPVAVTLTVGAPRIALSTRAVTFGDTVGSGRTLAADVFVANSGAGDLSSLGALAIGDIRHGAGEPRDWLLAPEGGRSLGSPVARLQAAVGDLPAGVYSARVPVTSTGGGSDTVTIRVVVNRPDHALDQPSIEITQDGRPVSAVTVSRPAGDTAQFAIRVQVRNPTNTALALTGLRIGATEYVSGARTGWVAGAFLDKTSAPFESPAELLVAVAPLGLPRGRYEADVPISSSVAKNSPRNLRVVLQIE